jgi:hypothetical protein
MNASADLNRFLDGQVEAAQLPHREHVRLAFEMLRRHDFAETALHYSNALKRIAANAGHPEAFNLTITLAFLALIGERMAADQAEDFETFAARNPELLDKGVLRRWYPAQRLSSALARRTFLLPEPG